MKKSCSSCGDVLPRGGFYVRSASPDGLTSSCKPCVKARQTEYRKTAPPIERPPKMTEAQLLAEVGDLHDRVYRHVEVKGDDECWPWTGASQDRGYGMVTINYWLYQAHRLTLTLYLGEAIADGLYADHECRNPNCVNPRHLRAVTPRVNAIENSEGPSAINAAKTHCVRGHEFTDDNTYIYPDGRSRACRECMEMYRAKASSTRTRRTDTDTSQEAA